MIQETLEGIKKRQLFVSNKGYRKPRQPNLHTVAYEANQYLCASPSLYQTPQAIEACLRALTPYALTKSEKLQLLNIQPQQELGLQLIVEDCDLRFSEVEIAEIIAIINETLPTAPHEGEEGGDEEEGGSNAGGSSYAMARKGQEMADVGAYEDAAAQAEAEALEAAAAAAAAAAAVDEGPELVQEARGRAGSEDELGEN